MITPIKGREFINHGSTLLRPYSAGLPPSGFRGFRVLGCLLKLDL